MDVLLVNPPTLYRARDNTPYYLSLLATDRTKRAGRSTLPGEHLGLQSLEASLREKGHGATVLNACVELHSDLQQTLDHIRRHAVDVIGFTGPSDVFAENLWLARRLREGGFTGHITMGHDFATLNHDTLLRCYSEIDSVIRGDGELTLGELVDALARREPLDAIPGLTHRKGAEVIVNPPRRSAVELDALPWVTRGSLSAVMALGMAPAIFTRRGCPYPCTFCTTGQVPVAEGLTGRDRWRRRSAGRVADELEMLVREHGAEHVTIVDDLYVSDTPDGEEHALQIADEILSRGLRLTYMIDARVDSIHRATFEVLARSGLRKVFVGVESGSDGALRLYRKGYRAEEIRRRLGILTELGIEYIIGFIFFSPLGTMADLARSYELVCDLDYPDPAVFYQRLKAYPGTSAHRSLAAQGLVRGEFPEFEITYRDPYVARLADMLGRFSAMALPLLHAATRMERLVRGSGTSLSASMSEAVYKLVRGHLRPMLDAARRADDQALQAAFDDMVGGLRRLTILY